MNSSSQISNLGSLFSRDILTKMIDEAWQKHDAEKCQEKKNYWAKQAFDLLEAFPENEIYLKVRQ